MIIRILCIALLIFPATVMAGVNTKNGNFYITYTDIFQKSDAKSGSRELNLTRTYNSKAMGIGWFGYGWGSPLETRILVMPDSSVVAYEYGIGTGRQNYYAPQNSGNLQAGVNVIVDEAIKRDKLDPKAAEALRAKLLANEDLRRVRVVEYGIQTHLPVGGMAQESPCSAVTRINEEEYRRTTCGEGTDYFDMAGRLIRHEDDGYKLILNYAGQYPDRIEDSLGQKLFLKWKASGRIDEARTDKAEPILQYSYDEKDNLLMANQRDGNVFRYEYDGNHNLTKIIYIDNTHMDMQYDEKNLIASVTEIDGSKTTYTYRYDQNNPSSHYWTTTTWISPTGKQSSREEEFSLTTDAAGVEKLSSMTRTEGQRKKDIILDEQGRVKRIQNPNGGFSEYTYHPTLNKVSTVVTDETRTDFEYNEAGGLISVKNSKGQLIRLDYDSKKNISRMIETNKTEHTRRELTFKYNELNKPVKIKLKGKGEINIEYDQDGEVAKVESTQGAKMALEVSRAFQALLDVVKAGGVDFGM